MLENIFAWIMHYKYAGVYLLQLLGILGFPIPDDSTLLLLGYFIHRRQLDWTPTILAAFLGSASGITISYLLGHTFGLFLLHRFGAKIGVTEVRLEKAHVWFRRVGKWALVFGYFLPGVRHLNGYVAGSSKLEFPVFALFAYPGALLWTTVFVAAGNWLGEGWKKFGLSLRPVDLWLLAAVVLALAVYFFLIRRRSRNPAGNA